MQVDWNLVAQVAMPVATLLLGAWTQRTFEKKVKLGTYYAHASEFQATPASGAAIRVRSHSVVVQNSGAVPATNVRIPHVTLPGHGGTLGGYDIFPPRQHAVAALTGGGAEIVIPKLEPGGQVLLTYLYFPPLLAKEIHLPVACDEALATHLNMQLMLAPPPWLLWIRRVLVVVGAVSVLYLCADAIRRLLM